MITSCLHHTSFPISDLPRARRFYEDLLGFEVADNRPDLPFAGVWYRIGDSELHLIVVPDGVDAGRRPAALNPMGPHVAFAVDNYDATLDYFRSRGVEVLETHPSIGQMWIRDPDGNILELIVSDRG